MGIALTTKQDWQLHVSYSQYSGGSTCQGKPNKLLIISTLLRRWRQAISQVKSSTLQLMIYRNHFVLYLPVKILKLFFLFAGRTLASPTTHSKQGYSRLPRWFLNPPKDGDLTASLRLCSDLYPHSEDLLLMQEKLPVLLLVSIGSCLSLFTFKKSPAPSFLQLPLGNKQCS